MRREKKKNVHQKQHILKAPFKHCTIAKKMHPQLTWEYEITVNAMQM